MDLKKLVWSKKGFVLNNDELFDFSDYCSRIEPNLVFFKTLKGKIAGIEKRKVWFQKYRDEVFWETEEEAIKDCYDYSESEKERVVLDKRLKELKKFREVEKHDE